MNIFVLDQDPVLAAHYQCDKHVVKMPTETAQLLSTNLRHTVRDDSKLSAFHIMQKFGLNHPATKWARLSQDNFEWLFNHGVALCREYEARYNREHAALSVILEVKAAMTELNLKFPQTGLTPFAQCMPVAYKEPDAVSAYRKFYLLDKSKFAKWAHSPKPFWWP